MCQNDDKLHNEWYVERNLRFKKHLMIENMSRERQITFIFFH